MNTPLPVRLPDRNAGPNPDRYKHSFPDQTSDTDVMMLIDYDYPIEL